MKSIGKVNSKTCKRVLLRNIVMFALFTSFFVTTGTMLLTNQNSDDYSIYSKTAAVDPDYININVYDEETLLGIDSASITIYDESDYPVYMDSTDSSGNLNVSIIAGTYTVAVSKQFYHDKNASVTLTEGEGKDLSIYMSPIITEGFIEVNVFDEFGDPMESATVELQDSDGEEILTQFTGSDGWVNFTGLGIGNYGLIASYAEYRDSRENITISYGKEGKYVSFHLLPLGGLGSIEVHVYELATGDPVEADVEIFDSFNSTVYSGSTGQVTGLFTAEDVATGTYRVEVAKDGVFMNQTKYCVIDFEDEVERLYFYLTPEGDNNAVIIVHTFDWNGIILDGVLVDCYDESGQVLVGSEFSNMSGIVNFTSLEKGWFKVVVSNIDYQTQIHEVNVNFNGDIDHVYVYLVADDEEVVLEVSVKDNDTTLPLDQAQVQIYSLTRGMTGLFGCQTLVTSVQTNVSGLVVISGLEVGMYRIVISKSGYHSQMRLLSMFNTNVAIPVYFGLSSETPNGKFTVTVLSGDEPVLFARVEVIDGSGESIGVNFTDLYGQCTFINLISGWYNISVRQTGYISETKIVHLLTSEDHQLIDFQLIKADGTGFIELHVYSAADNKFINMALVEVFEKETNDHVASMLTKSIGKCNITRLKIGWYRLIISAPGFVTVEEEVFIIGEGYGVTRNVWIPVYIPKSFIEIKVHSFIWEPGDPNWIENAIVEVHDSSQVLIAAGLPVWLMVNIT